MRARRALPARRPPAAPGELPGTLALARLADARTLTAVAAIELWELIRFLHIVALATFVGGQVVLVAAVVPVLGREPEETMLRIARRFGIVTAAAIVVLVGTGIAMASRFSLWQSDVLQAKLAVVVLVGVLVGLHIVSPRSRPLALALVASSLLVVWFGVELSH